jgi:hypothetical protein
VNKTLVNKTLLFLFANAAGHARPCPAGSSVSR